MTDLAFQFEFVDRVLDGSKPFTLRKAWANGATPEIESALRLVVFPRSPQRRVFASCRVEFRATVFFDPDGLTKCEHWRTASFAGPMSSRVRMHILTALARVPKGEHAARAAYARRRVACDALAVLDGFENWQAMWAWHDAHRALGSRRSLQREMIGLGLVTAELASAGA